MLNNINHLIFTLFNIGYLRQEPLAVYLLLSFILLFIIFFKFDFCNYNYWSSFYSLFFLQKTLNNFTKDDPKEIVIDEFIGQLIPLIICDGNLLLILLSFISFRFFDILKIYPANIFDKKIKGPIGIIGE